MKKILTYFAFGILLILGFHSFAQTQVPVELFEQHNYTDTWQTFLVNDQIAVEYKYVDCSEPDNGIYPENLLFKVTNTSATKLYVMWDYYLVYNDGSIITSSEGSVENTVQLTLDSGTSIEGVCGPMDSNKLSVYVQDKVDSDSMQLRECYLNDLQTFIIE